MDAMYDNITDSGLVCPSPFGTMDPLDRTQESVVPDNDASDQLTSALSQLTLTGNSSNTETIQQRAPIRHLPDEVLLNIFTHLNIVDSVSAGLTCAQFYHIHFELHNRTFIFEKLANAPDFQIFSYIESWMSRKYFWDTYYSIFRPQAYKNIRLSEEDEERHFEKKNAARRWRRSFEQVMLRKRLALRAARGRATKEEKVLVEEWADPKSERTLDYVAALVSEDIRNGLKSDEGFEMYYQEFVRLWELFCGPKVVLAQQ